MTKYFPPIVRSDDPGGMLLHRIGEFVRRLEGATFHRAVLRISDDPTSPVADHVTVLQQLPTCIVLMDYDMTLREVDPIRLHSEPND